LKSNQIILFTGKFDIYEKMATDMLFLSNYLAYFRVPDDWAKYGVYLYF